MLLGLGLELGTVELGAAEELEAAPPRHGGIGRGAAIGTAVGAAVGTAIGAAVGTGAAGASAETTGASAGTSVGACSNPLALGCV